MNNLFEIIKNEEFYINYMLAYHCMPVLYHMKPATLFNLNRSYLKWENGEIPAIIEITKRFQCRSFILYNDETKLLLYLYQPELLEYVLQQQNNQIFLNQFGYDLSEPMVTKTIVCLKERYLEYKYKKGEFPHEIGILLGYPLEDVIDFMIYNGQNFKYNGCWKVYHNVEQAKRTFQIYRTLRDEAVMAILSGSNLKKI